MRKRKPTCLEGVKMRRKYSTTTKGERKLDEFYKKKNVFTVFILPSFNSN
jgi:hypothetical protein